MDESFDKVIAGNVIHLLDEPYRALRELDRVCRSGGEIIIPTYMNRSSKGRTSGFAEAVGKAGADFKRQFTFESYQEFLAAAGYTDVTYTMIEGRVPCAVAVIRKGEHVNKEVRPGETCLCAKDEGTDYQTQISTARWIAYDIPGNLGWIAYFTGLGMSVYKGDYKYAAAAGAPESSDKRIAAGMCAGGAVCAAFAGLLLKGYKKTDAD